MARYTGPVWRLSRRLGFSVLETGKELQKRAYIPGQHGSPTKRIKQSNYGLQKAEKQKIRNTYGLSEKQFYNTYVKASKSEGVTGTILLQMLESRIDNLVYRMGIAPSRAAARQLVSHCHITLDGNVCNIPSTIVKTGSIVGVRERSKSLEVIQDSLNASAGKYPWLEWDAAKCAGKFASLPERSEIPETINEQLIVELYSK
jgi:small subunit ribosomal protein S4